MGCSWDFHHINWCKSHITATFFFKLQPFSTPRSTPTAPSIPLAPAFRKRRTTSGKRFLGSNQVKAKVAQQNWKLHESMWSICIYRYDISVYLYIVFIVYMIFPLELPGFFFVSGKITFDSMAKSWFYGHKKKTLSFQGVNIDATPSQLTLLSNRGHYITNPNNACLRANPPKWS